MGPVRQARVSPCRSMSPAIRRSCVCSGLGRPGCRCRMQIVGKPFQEATVFQVADAFERRLILLQTGRRWSLKMRNNGSHPPGSNTLRGYHSRIVQQGNARAGLHFEIDAAVGQICRVVAPRANDQIPGSDTVRRDRPRSRGSISTRSCRMRLARANDRRSFNSVGPEGLAWPIKCKHTPPATAL